MKEIQLNLFETKTIYDIIDDMKSLPSNVLIDEINRIKIKLHEISPFKNEPVDCVIWVKSDTVNANDYNPNSVAPPEMELLRVSIQNDGYTQPVVTWDKKEEGREVVDGFHRTRVCKECGDINERVMGYLPVVSIKADCQDRNDRIASTIRHNRARGKHNVQSMSDIVIELKKRNWSDSRIGKELGMDEDEVLRLCQISGLAEVFSNDEFSKSWEAEIFYDADFNNLSEDDIKEETTDTNRIYHTYEKWECHKAGFYSDTPPKGMTPEDCEIKYKNFLSNLNDFESGLKIVISDWRNSCEHYLTNDKMNRIAWLGQASVCAKYGIPSNFRGGFNLLTEQEQQAANELALKYLNIWLKNNGREELTQETAQSKTEANIY